MQTPIKLVAWQAPAFSVSYEGSHAVSNRSSAHPQLHLKNFISNRREQPAWAAGKSSSTIPAFRSTKSSTSPGAFSLTSSPTTRAKKVSGSSGSGWLSVKRDKRKERQGERKVNEQTRCHHLVAPRYHRIAIASFFSKQWCLAFDARSH